MGKKKILLIEDDQDNAFLITEELELSNIGSEVVLKKDGQEAMDYLSELDKSAENEVISQIELILLDLDLPKVNGMEILKFLKRSKRLCSIPAVIFSSISDQKTIDNACKNGADGFIAKSIRNYDKEFIENVRLLREYCKSNHSNSLPSLVYKETIFAVKCRSLIDNTIKKAKKVADLATEISNDSNVMQDDQSKIPQDS